VRGWLVRWLLGLRIPWSGRRFVGAGAAGHDVDVAAGCGAREQRTLQRGGTEYAAVEVGENRREAGGAEASRDDGECDGDGAVLDGGEEMAAVAERNADGVNSVTAPPRRSCGGSGSQTRSGMSRSMSYIITYMLAERKSYFRASGAWATASC
jgi:hypothetical protein